MITIIISAISKNNVIGLNGGIPWKCSEDMQLFKDLTTGHAVIMGFNTFKSLNYKPLKNRLNIVITDREINEDATKNVSIAPLCFQKSLISAIELCRSLNFDQCYVIGGESIYRNAMSIVDGLYISEIKESIYDSVGDTHFPEINESDWFLFSDVDYGDFVFKKYYKKRAREIYETKH